MKIFQRENGVHKRIPVPGDLFISHLTLILASVKEGDTKIENLCLNAEVTSTLQALEQLGVTIELDKAGRTALVRGVGLHGFLPPDDVINCGSSRETLYLLASVLCAQDFECILTCSPGSMRRTADRLIRTLNEMGADLYSEKADNTPPLHIRGRSALTGIEYTNRDFSPLLKSCVLLAGMYADSKPVITDALLSPDHTERLMQCMQDDHFLIPGDFTFASYLLALGASLPGSCLMLENVSINDSRICFLDILKDMGADLSVENVRIRTGEPSADLMICAAPLIHRDITREELIRVQNELLPLALVLIHASGTSTVNGLSELPYEALDRLECFVDNANWMRANIRMRDNSLKISGGTPLTGAVIHNIHNDPRLLMIFAVAGLAAAGCTVLDIPEGTEFPWPDYPKIIQSL